MNTNSLRRIIEISVMALLLTACDDVPSDSAPVSDPAELVNDGSDDRRKVRSNFQVEIDGVWRGVCCVDGLPTVTTAACTWSEYDRTLTDETAGQELDCPEGDPNGCWCNDDGERMHGFNGWELGASVYAEDGGPVYPDALIGTCLVMGGDRVLESEWSHEDCTYFKLD